MKRFFALCGIMLLSVFAVGCTKTIELTDEENKLIAEYAAELLIKYDRNINLKYDEAYIESLMASNTTEELTTEEPVTEEITTVEPTTENMVEEVASDTDASSTDISTEEVATEDITGASVLSSDYDIAEFIGEANVSIKYMYYMVVDHYPSYDKEGMYIEIEAPSGYKLLVLKFSMENKTDEEQYVDLYTKDINYKIILDNARAANQMLTILMDDLYTYQSTLEGSMYEETVLLFQLSNEVAQSMSDLKLQVECGDEQIVIQLQ